LHGIFSCGILGQKKFGNPALRRAQAKMWTRLCRILSEIWGEAFLNVPTTFLTEKHTDLPLVDDSCFIVERIGIYIPSYTTIFGTVAKTLRHIGNLNNVCIEFPIRNLTIFIYMHRSYVGLFCVGT
jgi:hypothetical protein